jgi:hypothetical protein
MPPAQRPEPTRRSTLEAPPSAEDNRIVDRIPSTARFVAGPGLPQCHQRIDGHERERGDYERYCDSLFHATLSAAGPIRSRTAEIPLSQSPTSC